jgi:6-phosphogluconolactonase
MDEVEWWDFETPAEMAEQVAGDIGFVIESAVEAHQGARVALPPSGPAEFYSALLAADCDWSKVSIVPTHQDGEGAPELACFRAKGATVVELSEQGLSDFSWPLDLVCLTVGEDGSVAGLRPGPDLERAITAPRERRLVAAAGGATLTAPAIVSARALMIVAVGDAQREVIERAIKDGPLSSAPVGRLLAEVDASIDIFWTAGS